MQEGFSLELIAVRRILEPPATAMAAARIEDDTIIALDELLVRMEAADTQGDRIAHDAAFHALVATTSGNATLASMLSAVSSRTIRARAWRGLVEESAGSRTVAQHREILEALRDRDPDRASAAALVHVATTEAWFRQTLAEDDEL